MHNFQYITKSEAKPVRDELYTIIRKVQDLVRDNFTFQFRTVGSSSRNMITRDMNSNIGFDFDFDLEVNDDDENYTPAEIHNIVKNAIDQVAPQYGYKLCEELTRVLRIKKVNTYTCKILHSCDFAIVYDCGNGNKQYIRFNKNNQKCTWEFQSKGFKNFDKRYNWLIFNGYRKELKGYYLNKKNNNNNPDKHSCSILAESVNEMYQKKLNKSFDRTEA